MNYSYDPHKKGFSYYRCETCQVVVEHSSDLIFVHRPNCPKNPEGIDGTTYFISPLEIMCFNKWGGQSVCGRVTAEILSQFPEQVRNLTFS